MNLANFGKKEYLKFCNYEGSQHIASEFAIVEILKLIKQFNITSILEIGLGIGSISSTVLSAFKDKDLVYVGTEGNSFCLDSLRKNLTLENYNRLEIVDSFSDAIELNKKYNLIIIDGSYDNFVNLKNQLDKNSIIVIEGDRKSQELDIKTIFPLSRYAELLSYKRNNVLSNKNPLHWQGGMKVFFLEPSLQQNIYWSIQKIKTKCGYFYRKNLSKKS